MLHIERRAEDVKMLPGVLCKHDDMEEEEEEDVVWNIKLLQHDIW